MFKILFVYFILFGLTFAQEIITQSIYLQNSEEAIIKYNPEKDIMIQTKTGEIIIGKFVKYLEENICYIGNNSSDTLLLPLIDIDHIFINNPLIGDGTSVFNGNDYLNINPKQEDIQVTRTELRQQEYVFENDLNPCEDELFKT